MAGLPAHQLKGDRREGSGRAPRATEETDKSLRCARIEGRQLLQWWLDRRVQDPKCARLRRARPEEVHGEESGKRAKGARFAEGQVPPAAPTSEDAKPSRTDLAPCSAKHTRSGPSTLGGLGDKGGGTRRTRTAPDYLHSAAQTEPWPHPGRRRSTRRVPQQRAATRVSEAATKQISRTLPETARAAAPATELRQGRGGAEAKGLRAVWEQEVVLLPKSHKHWSDC